MVGTSNRAKSVALMAHAYFKIAISFGDLNDIVQNRVKTSVSMKLAHDVLYDVFRSFIAGVCDSGFALGIYAQIKLSSTYGKYMRVPAESGLSGAQAARRILDRCRFE